MPNAIEPILTLGNVITIVIFLLGLIIQATLLSGKISRFMTQSEMDRLNLHRDVEAAKVNCVSCYTKTEVASLDKETERIDKEQIKLRAELPLKLDEIWKEIKTIRTLLEQRRYEHGDKGEQGMQGI